MAGKKAQDAWEDDWETLADKAAHEEPSAPEQTTPMTRAERLAKHEEANRKIWEAAESPDEFQFVAVGPNVPSPAAGFRPAVKLLSRKPAPQLVEKKDPVTGMRQMTLQDDDEPEEAKSEQTPEERELRRQKDLEEKQRRYEEAKAKIFGEPPRSNPPSGRSSPGSVTPPQSFDSRQQLQQQQQQQYHRGRGRGRGGYRGDGYARHDSQARRPTSQGSGARELFDPNYSPKPGLAPQRRAEGGGSPRPSGRSTTPRAEDQVLRAPKGPDNSGRGGFGFARRGANDG